MIAISLSLITMTPHVLNCTAMIKSIFSGTYTIEKWTLEFNFWSSGGFLNDLLIVGIAFLVYWIYAVARLAYVETEHTV